MRKICIALVVVAFLVSIVIVVPSFLLKATVEDVTREALASSAGPGAEAAFEELSFSPLTREILIRDWRSRRIAPDGSVSSYAGSMRGVIPLRGILACLPGIADVFNNDSSSVPVLTDVRMSDLRFLNSTTQSSASSLSIDTVRISYPLLKEYLAGERPPFAMAVAGIHLDTLTVTDQALAPATPNPALILYAKNLTVKNIAGPSADSLEATQIRAIQKKETVSSCDSLRLSRIAVSPALLSELIAFQANPNPTPFDIGRVLQTLQKNGPVLARALAANVAVTLPEGSALVREAEFNWKNISPNDMDVHLRGMSLPEKLIRNVTGIRLRGHTNVELEADITSSGLLKSRQTGVIRAKRLGDLSYSFLWSTFTASLSDLKATFRDNSLTAQVALNLMPEIHASSMLLKIGAPALCIRDPEDRKKSCRELARFIDRPGTITITTDPGRPLQLGTIFEGINGSLGSLFRIDVLPGTRSLSEQADGIQG